MLLTANQHQVIRIEHILPQRSGTEAAAFNNQVRLELGKLNVRFMERHIAKQELRSMLFYGWKIAGMTSTPTEGEQPMVMVLCLS